MILGAAKPTGAVAASSGARPPAPRLRAAPRTQAVPREDTPPLSTRLSLGLVSAAAALSLALAGPATAADGPFLKSTGARGLLAEEEATLFQLRKSEEAKAREELTAAYNEFKEEEKRSQVDKFCATPFGIDVVGITEFVALTGALVGGISARRRKQELERLNEQLRTINTQLRQQARAGTLFAPGLTYAPPALSGADGFNSSSGGGGGIAGIAMRPMGGADSATKLSLPSGAVRPPTPPPTPKPAVPTAAAASGSAVVGAPEAPTVGLVSMDEDENRPEVQQCQAALKEGKKLLKEANAGGAMVRFEKALMLAKSLGDRVRERRAVRGLAAASRLSNQPRSAIKYLVRVLEISEDVGDHVGDADAYGVIADIYTDIGEFEKAAEYYDKYIGQMASDGPV